MCKIKDVEVCSDFFKSQLTHRTGCDADYPSARRLGAFWGLCARPALSSLSFPRTLERERAFPSGRPRRRGRREKSRRARCLLPAAQRAPPVEVNFPHPFLSPARPPSARPRRLQPQTVATG
nr:uncharacterized protein LOC129135726 [Pan troglodytes]